MVFEVFETNQFGQRNFLEEVEVFRPLRGIALFFDFEVGEFLREFLLFFLEQLQVVELEVLEEEAKVLVAEIRLLSKRVSEFLELQNELLEDTLEDGVVVGLGFERQLLFLVEHAALDLLM